MKDTKGVRQVLEELANTVFRHGQARRTNTPFHYGEPVKEAETTLQEIMLGMLPEEKDYASGDEIVEFGVNMSINIPEVDAWNECRTQMEQNIRGGFNNG